MVSGEELRVYEAETVIKIFYAKNPFSINKGKFSIEGKYNETDDPPYDHSQNNKPIYDSIQYINWIIVFNIWS